MAADLPTLQRTSNGLTEAHVELIRLLAAVAVEDFLRENESDEAMQTIDEDQA